MSCPDTGIRGFPIKIGNGIVGLEDINKSLEEELLMYVSWGPRSNAPKFKQNSPLLDEGIENPSASPSTLRYNNIQYTLNSVQITQPQHASFVTGGSAMDVSGEAIISFSNQGGIGDSYIFLCIPILQARASSGSEYIEAILSDRLNRRQLTLDSLLPEKRKCVTYNTCLTKTDSRTNQSKSVQAQVFVFVFGLQETANRLGLLRVASKGRGAREFASMRLPDNLQPASLLNSFTIQGSNEYRTLIRYRTFPTPSAASPADSLSNRRTDPISAYQCVPLKPDENVKDGKIVIDTDKGVPLSQVLDEKKAEEGDTGNITPGDIERLIAIIFGTLIGLFVLSILAYGISILTSANAGPSFPRVREFFAGMLPMTFVAVGVGIVGFLIGFFAQRI